MPAIDFPSSPTLNQEFTAGTTIYKWNGSFWEVKQSTLSSSSFSSSNPTMNGTVAAGTSNLASRSDHVHPSDTSRASATDLSTHTSATTSVHGISNTANLVYTGDSRLTDSRTPTAHASSHGSAGSDAITIAQSQVTNLATDLSAKAPLASPTFTGTPTAPTASADTDTTQLATTSYVIGQASSVSPLALGSVSVGTSNRYARADHVHPTTGLGLTSGTLAQFSSTTSSQLAGIISDETGTGSLVFSSSPTLTYPVFTSMEETVNIAATAATGTINLDVLTSSIWYFTSNSSGNWTLNIRGNSGTTFNSILNTGQSIAISFLVTNGATAYYQTALQIDGVSVTPKWGGGVAPTSGNANSIDIYSISIIKTGSSAYTVIESQTKVA